MLLSGGLDSATTLAMAKAEGYALYALTVTYGQRHGIEVKAAKRIGEALGVREHKIINVELDKLGGSALTGVAEIPKDRYDIGAEIPATYVPARNAVLLSIALGYAEVVGSKDIFIGVNAVDYSGYPDCRPQFILAYETMARVGTKAGVEGVKIRIHAPLIQLSKARIIQRAIELGLDIGMTHSCYDPGPGGEACGRCDSCIIRERAFTELGLEDPSLARPQ